MAQTENTTTTGALGSGTFGASGFEAFFPLAKEAWGLQLKTAQMMLDTTTKLSQSFADYYQKQADEGLQLTQTCLSTGKTIAEEVRRQVTTFAERATRQA